MQTDLTVHTVLGAPLAQAVATKLEQAQVEDVQRKVRAGEPTLWAPAGTPEVANRLGWLTIAARMEPTLPEIESFRDQLLAEGISEAVLLGMGGSSLAPEVLRRTHSQQDQKAGQGAGLARVRVLDSTNPGAIASIDRSIEAAKTLFLVSSKSGSTIEPRSMLEHYFEIIPQGAHFAAITDPHTELEALARERGFRQVFAGDPDIGGRYSALSAFGIVPGVLIGVDAAALLHGAQAAWETTISASASLRTIEQPARSPTTPRASDPPAWLWLGAALSTLASIGKDKLTFIVPHTLDGLGLWLEQLFAESTGKRHRGILPVAQEPLLAPDAYGEDRVFVQIQDLSASDPAQDQAVAQLAQAGHPLITIPTTGPRDLGRIFMLAELTVAVVGWGLSINPFDQPNVQEAKDATNRVLAQRDEDQQIEDGDLAQLSSLLATATPPSYVAIMGYVQPSQEFDAAIAQLREQIMLARNVTTTFGYGPRFLHSTGQFHKGGPPTGRFLQLVHIAGADIAIPGKPYTFGELHQAQADGDLQTLRTHSLPVQRVTLQGDDPAAALRELTQAIVQGALRS